MPELSDTSSSSDKPTPSDAAAQSDSSDDLEPRANSGDFYTVEANAVASAASSGDAA